MKKTLKLIFSYLYIFSKNDSSIKNTHKRKREVDLYEKHVKLFSVLNLTPYIEYT